MGESIPPLVAPLLVRQKPPPGLPGRTCSYARDCAPGAAGKAARNSATKNVLSLTSAKVNVIQFAE